MVAACRAELRMLHEVAVHPGISAVASPGRNDAVDKFKRFEDAGLVYVDIYKQSTKVKMLVFVKLL
jgi:hypothetical protein